MVAPTLAGGGSVPSPDALQPVLFKDLLASGLEGAASLHAATSGVPTMGAATRTPQSGNDSTGTASPDTAEHHHIAFYLPLHAATTGASDSIGKKYGFAEVARGQGAGVSLYSGSRP
jgi:hypothetical protein